MKPLWRSQPVDGGVLHFERSSGTNVLLRGGEADRLVRRAPRALQVGLLTPCNLSCSFCYRDTSAPSRLTSAFLVDLLARCADWGVLEVAFGGGEPLLFKGFARLLRELSERTSLGLNFTTNGMLIDDEFLAEAGDFTGEIRVSAYPENHYRRTLRRLAGRQVGTNWIVTPANVGLVEPTVRDMVSLGAKNVMLLGYKGEDASMHLGPGEIDVMRRAISRLSDVEIRLDICWHPLLPDVPQLFSRADCGAGDEFLVITPDRAVQPCSFHHERVPFETFEDLVRIYDDMRARRPAARIGGCTRALFAMKSALPMVSMAPAEPPRAYVWRSHASNNSGSFTIVGRFKTAKKAASVAKKLRKLARDHDAFVASKKGKKWEESHSAADEPTPPLVSFGEKNGFEWTEPAYYDAIGAGTEVFTAGAIGCDVVVHHRYCSGFGDPFDEYFEAEGGQPGAALDASNPLGLLVKARGGSAGSRSDLRRLVAESASAASPGDATPPWGLQARDARLGEDENRSARLVSAVQLDEEDDRIRMRVKLENPYAGALAVEAWLRAAGFEEVEVAFDLDRRDPGEEAPARDAIPPGWRTVVATLTGWSRPDFEATFGAYMAHGPADLPPWGIRGMRDWAPIGRVLIQRSDDGRVEIVARYARPDIGASLLRRRFRDPLPVIRFEDDDSYDRRVALRDLVSDR